MARKMLFIADEIETLINFSHTFNSCSNNSNESTEVYANGNLVDRSEVTNFLNLENVERTINREHDAKLKSDYLKNLPDNCREIGLRVAETSVKKQAEYNILHNMIEYVLSDLTGLEEIAHNRMRKDNPELLSELIKSKLQESSAFPHDELYYIEKLSKLIDKQGAEQIAPILKKLFELLKNHSSKNNESFHSLVNNWVLNYNFADELISKDLNPHFIDYVEKHHMLGLMSGMANAETPILESKPFFGFKSETYNLYDNNGVLVEKAKRRKHSSLEILDTNSRAGGSSGNNSMVLCPYSS